MEGALIICQQCDAVHERPRLPAGAYANCLRCGAELYRHSRVSLDGLLALALAGLLVLVIANIYPIVELEVGAERTRATLLGAVVHTALNGLMPLAAITLFSLFICPLLQIACTLYVLAHFYYERRPRWFVEAMQLLRLLRPWSMIEVFLLGALVALVKLAATSTVIPGVGLWAFGVLTMILTVIGSFDLREIWSRGAEFAA